MCDFVTNDYYMLIFAQKVKRTVKEMEISFALQN